jgi:hypothetical protein
VSFVLDLFYLLERELMVQDAKSAQEKIRLIQKFRSSAVEEKPEDRIPLPVRYRGKIVMSPHWYDPNKKEKRKHRKTHGKISFQDLCEMISKNWSEIDEETKNYCTTLSDIGRKRYMELKKRYNASQKIIELKKEQAQMIAEREKRQEHFDQAKRLKTFSSPPRTKAASSSKSVTPDRPLSNHPERPISNPHPCQPHNQRSPAVVTPQYSGYDNRAPMFYPSPYHGSNAGPPPPMPQHLPPSMPPPSMPLSSPPMHHPQAPPPQIHRHYEYHQHYHVVGVPYGHPEHEYYRHPQHYVSVPPPGRPPREYSIRSERRAEHFMKREGTHQQMRVRANEYHRNEVTQGYSNEGRRCPPQYPHGAFDESKYYHQRQQSRSTAPHDWHHEVIHHSKTHKVIPTIEEQKKAIFKHQNEITVLSKPIPVLSGSKQTNGGDAEVDCVTHNDAIKSCSLMRTDSLVSETESIANSLLGLPSGDNDAEHQRFCEDMSPGVMIADDRVDLEHDDFLDLLKEEELLPSSGIDFQLSWS